MSLRMRMVSGALALAWALSACNGSSSPPDTPAPPPGGENPCTTASLEERGYVAPVPARAPEAVARKTQVVDGDPRWRVLDALWTHHAAGGRRAAAEAPRASDPNHIDIGEIAIVQDQGEIVLPANSYDLRSLGLRFARNGSGGYDVTRIDGTFRPTLGTRLTLQDDDTVRADGRFPFSFYGRLQTAVFVNSDGNVTFEQGDNASTERNVSRLLTGPPRVAPFLADLDPSAGGNVYVNAADDQYTVTWCDVRGFESTRTTRVQATLLPSGTIELKFGDNVTLDEAVVGISPGRTAAFTTVNLSDAGPTAGGGGAVGERFAADSQMDAVALTRKFYQEHDDLFDQLVIWTDRSLVDDAFAFESTVANEIQGIGIDRFDASREFGSAGRLRSYAMMDTITKYPDDPLARVPGIGENTTVSVLGQEVGHRWLAFLRFQNSDGQSSTALLGRGQSHWSFFMDSDASVMEGNDIEELPDGSFRTVATVSRYSLLDQYAMGLVLPSQVPPVFYVANPTNVQPVAREADDAPRTGVTFAGTKVVVRIEDIIAIHGNRVPAASPAVHRQAFIFLVSAGRPINDVQVAKVDRIRRAWETFFLEATEGRMRANTSLR